MKQPLDEVSLYPFKRELKGYNLQLLKKDLIAALTVVMITVPQSMAYALLAGVPISCGLVAAIYASLMAALFGSSRHLVIGPSNALALLLMSGTAEILYTYYRDLEGPARTMVTLQILTQITLLTGTIQVCAACFKLGKLSQFVSSSVIVGYMAGTAVAVVVNQLFPFFGLSSFVEAASVFEKGTYLLTHISAIHWPTALVGVGALALFATLKTMNRSFPSGVVTLIIASGAVTLIGLADPSVAGVALVGNGFDIHALIPNFSIPAFHAGVFNAVLPIAFALALLSVMETTSVAKTIAASSGQAVSSNQELFALGVGNLTSCLVSGLPVSGSITRSQINFESGGATRFAAVFSALFVLLFVFGFGFFLSGIPVAAMSALLLVTAVGIIDKQRFAICHNATTADAAVLWTTFLSCIFLSLDVAFYIGVGLSITLYLKKAAVPLLHEYELTGKGEMRHLEPEEEHQERAIRLIKVEGELFFGAADPFQTTLKALTDDHSDTRVIILQLKNARDMDGTACLALHHLYQYLHRSGRHLIICGMTPHIWQVFRSSGIDKHIGTANLFCFDEHRPNAYLYAAWKRAEALSLQMVRVEGVDADNAFLSASAN